MLLALLAVSIESQAQSTMRGSFSRVVNQYRWTSDLSISEQTDRSFLSLDNRFRSDAYILFDNRLSFRDEDRYSLAWRQRLGAGSEELVMYSRGGWYSLSDVISGNAYAGVRFQGPSGVIVEPLLGAAVDRRPGVAGGDDLSPLRTDAGPAAGLNAMLPLSNFDGYLVEATGYGRYEVLSSRRGDLARLLASVRKSFSSLATTTRLKVATARRDAYQPASFFNRDESLDPIAETVESTRSDTLDASLDLIQQVSGSVTVGGHVAAGISRRRVRILSAPESALIFDTDFERDDFAAGVDAEYSKESWLLRLAVTASAQVEERRLVNAEELPEAQAAQKQLLLRQADFNRGVVEARLTSRAPVFARTVAQLDVSANIVRHDTPELNPDDRDELFYRGQFGLSSALTEELDVQLQFFGTWFHTVYLRSIRSAENSVQRSLRFRPTVRWRPRPGTRIELVSQVRATYTIDDFLLPGRSPSDQSARELRYDIDAEHSIGAETTLLFTGRISDLRLGRLVRDEFAEVPFDSLLTTNLWAGIRMGRELQAELGYRMFVRSDFDRAVTVDYGESSAITRQGRRSIRQSGPTATLNWALKRGSFLRLEGWAIVQRVTYELYGNLPEEDAAEIRRSASAGRRSVIPNLTLSLQWQF